jgi:HJR/Mrr/RecB family endonuclease
MRNKRYYEDDSLERGIAGIILLYGLYLFGLYFTNRANFWRMLIYGLLVVIGIAATIFYWVRYKENKKRKRFDSLLKEIQKAGQEEFINNFINRFGLEGRKGKGWTFRNHVFDWDRINDLEKDLSKKIENIHTDKNNRDIFAILKYYIQEKEEKLTLESIKKEPQKFASLTGTEFEKLIYRLATAMSYSTEWIGKSGDQGGDLIANKNGDRTLIQTKCYRDWSTGNGAVQQVVAAMKFYDCNKAVVITTSYFTPAAITLAKANKVDLISKEKLQKMLLDYLGESWS